MKSFVLVTICALLAIEHAQAQFVHADRGYYILGLKSVWQGFNRGFYKRSGKTAMSDNCIDESTLNRYYNFMAIWEGVEAA